MEQRVRVQARREKKMQVNKNGISGYKHRTKVHNKIKAGRMVDTLQNSPAVI